MFSISVDDGEHPYQTFIIINNYVTQFETWLIIPSMTILKDSII